MKLLFCIKAMSSPGGGAEKVLANVTSGLARRGHQVTVLTFDRPGCEPYYPLNPSIKRLQLGLGSTTDRATLFTTLRRIRALRGVIVQQSPDVVIGFMHSMYIPLGFSLLGLDPPLIASEHIVYAHYAERMTQAVLLGLTPLLAERITCVSEQARRSFPTFLQRHMVVVPNPIIASGQQRADVVGAGRRKIVLNVGRLDSQKDHVTLLSAFARIAGSLPDWDLHIVGEGPLRPVLEEQASSLGLTERIKLMGPTKDVSKEYLRAQLFVVPSRYESFSLVTAEALAHGLPVVAFADCCGPNQLVTHGYNGLLVEKGERSDSLASALRLLMEKTELRVQLSSGRSELPEQNLEHVLDIWENLLSESNSGRRR